MIPPYFIVTFKLFPLQVQTRYVFLIPHTKKKLKYKRNFKTQDEVNLAYISKMANTEPEKYNGPTVVQVILQMKTLKQRCTRHILLKYTLNTVQERVYVRS